MSELNPKLEFYRFTLTNKYKKIATFTDFVNEEIKDFFTTETNVSKILFAYIIKSLDGKYSKNDKFNKQIKLDKQKGVNKHLTNEPKLYSEKNIISGVISGGSYGRDRILANVVDPIEGEPLDMEKSVLEYYYFLLYLPLDYNEGCLILHSNSREENITNIFKDFIQNIFKRNDFKIEKIFNFAPKEFQEEFRKNAIIDTIEFRETNIDKIITSKGTTELLKDFDITVKIIPHSKNILLNKTKKVIDKLTSLKISSNEKNKNKEITNFSKIDIQAKDKTNNSTCKFQWNTKDNTIIPVIYLKDLINEFNLDETPNFERLQELCLDLFEKKVLKEIRPDLNVTKSI